MKHQRALVPRDPPRGDRVRRKLRIQVRLLGKLLAVVCKGERPLEMLSKQAQVNLRAARFRCQCRRPMAPCEKGSHDPKEPTHLRKRKNGMCNRKAMTGLRMSVQLCVKHQEMAREMKISSIH